MRRAFLILQLAFIISLSGCFEDAGIGGTGEVVVPPQKLHEINTFNPTPAPATQATSQPTSQPASQPTTAPAQVELSIEQCRRLALQNNLMVRVEALDGPRHAAFGEWLTRARAGGVPFAEQVERMPRNRVVASQAVYIRTYATKDGALAVACGSPSLRRKFIAAIGHKDPALTEPVADVEGHYAALRAAVEATIASRTTQEWKAALDAAGVPASGVALPVEILDDPQPAANAMFQRFEHPTLGPVTVLGPPVQVDDGGFVPGPPTPPFGSEARAILAWAGFAERDVERLLAGGAVTPTS